MPFDPIQDTIDFVDYLNRPEVKVDLLKGAITAVVTVTVSIFLGLFITNIRQ